MDSIIVRSVIIYIFLFIILRIAGKRTLGEMTSFDFILLLIISEATQSALTGDDHSIMGSMQAIVTLVSVDIVFSIFTTKFKLFDKIANGVPIIILQDGKLLTDRMAKERIEESDILEAAREQQGLESIGQIKFAVLEKNGKISIIPYLRNLQ